MWEFIFGFLMGKHQSTYNKPIEDDELIYIPSYFIKFENYGSLLSDVEFEKTEIVFDKCYVELVLTDTEGVIYVQREKLPSAHMTRTCYGCEDADIWIKEMKKSYPNATVKRESEPIWINVLEENKRIVLQTDTFKYEGVTDYAKCLDKKECQKLLIKAREYYEKYTFVETRYMERP